MILNSLMTKTDEDDFETWVTVANGGCCAAGQSLEVLSFPHPLTIAVDITTYDATIDERWCAGAAAQP